MKHISFAPPDITEKDIEMVSEILRSKWITTGAATKEFEKEIANYCSTAGVVCLNSATAALELTLRILGIGPGDEVITSAYTYTATAAVIRHVGAKIVLVDVAPNSFHLDYDQVEKAITKKTKAIIPVDIGGVMCDYSRLYSIVEGKEKLFCPKSKFQKNFKRIIIIADAAHSLGTQYKYRMSGNTADFTCFSFHAVKNITTAEGGAITWRSHERIDDQKLYNLFKITSLHGQTNDAMSKSISHTWEYDVITPGFKCNMTDISAAIGLSQLKRYDSTLKKREEIVDLYNDFLSSERIEILLQGEVKTNSSKHLYLTRIKDIEKAQRNEIISRLSEKGISANVHYKPLPELTAYKNMGFRSSDFPNSYNQFENEITLPLHPGLTPEDVEYISFSFLEIIKKLLRC